MTRSTSKRRRNIGDDFRSHGHIVGAGERPLSPGETEEERRAKYERKELTLEELKRLIPFESLTPDTEIPIALAEAYDLFPLHTVVAVYHCSWHVARQIINADGALEHVCLLQHQEGDMGPRKKLYAKKSLKATMRLYGHTQPGGRTIWRVDTGLDSRGNPTSERKRDQPDAGGGTAEQ